MARTIEGLSSGVLVIGVNAIYPSSGKTSLTVLVLTNTENTVKTCSIYLDRGISRLLDTVTVPANKAVRVSVVNGVVLDATDELTITASAGSINYDLSGWVVT
jgi:hypothetical protein